MKEHEVRLTATGIIWAAFTVVMIGAMIFSYNLGGTLILILGVVLAVAALAATNIVWKRRDELLVEIERAEKSKRRSRVETLLDSMSDAELDELRDRLSEDGELVSLNEVLAARERQRR